MNRSPANDIRTEIDVKLIKMSATVLLSFWPKICCSSTVPDKHTRHTSSQSTKIELLENIVLLKDSHSNQCKTCVNKIQNNFWFRAVVCFDIVCQVVESTQRGAANRTIRNVRKTTMTANEGDLDATHRNQRTTSHRMQTNEIYLLNIQVIRSTVYNGRGWCYYSR